MGAAVRARRKAVALSQETLADAAEVDRSHNCLRFISRTIIAGYTPPGANVSFGSNAVGGIGHG
ncbi:transcriptional regulator [Pseudomonas brassicacearum]|nr:transcriptional regulator [Pseudomonas brassicacearum]